MNFLKSIPLSFYSRAFYYDVVHNKRGSIYQYLLILFVIFFLSMAKMGGPMVTGIYNQIPQVAATLPETTIKDGVLSINAPSPHYVKIGETDPFNIMIDTNYTVTDIEAVQKTMDDMKIHVLVTATKMVARKSDNRIEIHEFDQAADYGTITHENWISVGSVIQSWFYPVVLISIFVGLFFGLGFVICIAALFAQLASLAFGLKLTFGDTVRLAAVASIPHALVTLLLPPPLWLGAALRAGYIIFGLIVAKGPTQTPRTIDI